MLCLQDATTVEYFTLLHVESGKIAESYIILHCHCLCDLHTVQLLPRVQITAPLGPLTFPESLACKLDTPAGQPNLWD